MKHPNPCRTTRRGFTLIEMAIVLMIIGLLLGGILVPLNAQMNQRNNSDTQKSLSEIRDALIGYVMANGYLPCPANPTDVTGVTSTAGIARTTCTGTSATGVLPWATLGISETDAWGNRFTYRVTPDYADAIASATYGGCTPSPTPTQASFGLCSVGNLNVWSSASKTTSVATNVVAIVISHGQNGAGAYTPQGVQLPRGSSADELENSDGSADLDYVSHLPTPAFDDLLIWIPPSILNSRMVSAGKLP